jgi:hypothetical protein
MQMIRTMHPYGFRSGRWAILRCIVPGPVRDCYLVEFEDYVTDFWAVDDPDGQYEFCERTVPS